jgi:arylamine N-acetyltransferase
MTPHLNVSLTIALLLTLPTVAHAKVVAHSATGFVVEHQVDLKTDANSAYDAFTQLGSWWSSSHSFSGDAKNITIDTKPGGCWCETLPNGGFVKHMDIVHAAPGKMLVFSGGLGPLQFMGVAGSMTVSFQTAKATSVTTMKLRYDVGGRDDKNFEDISKAVDGVLAEQIARYKNFATTGKP